MKALIFVTLALLAISMVAAEGEESMQLDTTGRGTVEVTPLPQTIDPPAPVMPEGCEPWGNTCDVDEKEITEEPEEPEPTRRSGHRRPGNVGEIRIIYPEPEVVEPEVVEVVEPEVIVEPVIEPEEEIVPEEESTTQESADDTQNMMTGAVTGNSNSNSDGIWIPIILLTAAAPLSILSLRRQVEVA